MLSHSVPASKKTDLNEIKEIALPSSDTQRETKEEPLLHLYLQKENQDDRRESQFSMAVEKFLKNVATKKDLKECEVATSKDLE
jgi:hypothetical protein